MSISKIFSDISKQCEIMANETKGKTTSESLIQVTKDAKKSICGYLNNGIEAMEKELHKERQEEMTKKVSEFANKAGQTAYKAPKSVGRGFAAFLKPFKEGWEEEMSK